MLETYLPMFVMFAIVAVISSVMFLGGQFIGPKNPNPEKLSPFECGNDTEGAKNTKLSVKFYLTAILFVVFDIEVVFMYPWAALFKGLGWSGFATMFSFIVALVVALAYCWKKGALEWES
jgi:NADH-quinone oxidoreductase subunit A